MSRRVCAAILLVTALAIVVFAVPLALGARRLYREEAVTRLERAAQAASASLASQLARTGTTDVELPDDDGTQLAAYDQDGHRLDGVGPTEGDAVVTTALTGAIQDSTDSGRLVVAVPVNDEDRVIGAGRASVPVSDADRRAHGAWATMAALGLVVLALAVVVARLAARRIARPVDDLAAAARRLGEGDFTLDPPQSGLAELDDVGAAMASTARRLGTAMERERAFTADTSHQLRTPVTSLRLRLESTQVNPDADHAAAVNAALEDVDRLEQTINDLLALNRDAPSTGDEPLDLGRLLDDVEQRWHGTLAADGRPLRLRHNTTQQPMATAGAVRQTLDVLVDNAHRHGCGTVTVVARDADNAIAVDVSDEGPGPGQPPGELFQRRSPSATGTGIGLALARSLVESQGGRLVHTAADPAQFTLLLPVADAERHLTEVVPPTVGLARAFRFVQRGSSTLSQGPSGKPTQDWD